jgi:hypothetical protein
MLIAYGMAYATSRVAAHSPEPADPRLVVDGYGDGWFSDASNQEGRAAQKSKGFQLAGGLDNSATSTSGHNPDPLASFLHVV